MFKPELGQAIFGQGYQEIDATSDVNNFVSLLSLMLDEGYKKKLFEFSPTVGGGLKFPSFLIEAYSWDDDYDQPYNFRYFPLDFRVSWYKYPGRSVSMNKKLSLREFATMVSRCTWEVYAALSDRKWRKENVIEGYELAGEYR